MPVSHRRFPKNPSVDILSQPNNMAWALLQILLHIRRSAPNLNQIIANGTPTSRGLIYRFPNNATSIYLPRRIYTSYPVKTPTKTYTAIYYDYLESIILHLLEVDLVSKRRGSIQRGKASKIRKQLHKSIRMRRRF